MPFSALLLAILAMLPLLSFGAPRLITPASVAPVADVRAVPPDALLVSPQPLPVATTPPSSTGDKEAGPAIDESATSAAAGPVNLTPSATQSPDLFSPVSADVQPALPPATEDHGPIEIAVTALKALLAPLPSPPKAVRLVNRANGPASITAAQIVDRAEASLAVPYVWGGVSDSGLDCSAYVSRAWGLARNTTETLPGFAFTVDKEELLPGDILNLTISRDPRGYGHVRLFQGWANTSHTRIWVYEETPPRSVHHIIAYDDRYVPMRRVNYVPSPNLAIPAVLTLLDNFTSTVADALPGGQGASQPPSAGDGSDEEIVPDPESSVSGNSADQSGLGLLPSPLKLALPRGAASDNVSAPLASQSSRRTSTSVSGPAQVVASWPTGAPVGSVDRLPALGRLATQSAFVAPLTQPSLDQNVQRQQAADQMDPDGIMQALAQRDAEQQQAAQQQVARQQAAQLQAQRQRAAQVQAEQQWAAQVQAQQRAAQIQAQQQQAAQVKAQQQRAAQLQAEQLRIAQLQTERQRQQKQVAPQPRTTRFGTAYERG